MELGLHWLQLETVAYLVGQLKPADCLSGPNGEVFHPKKALGWTAIWL